MCFKEVNSIFRLNCFLLSHQKHWTLDMNLVASTLPLLWYFVQQISLSKQHGQTNVFLFVHSLPHFFLFFSCMYFSFHSHLYFFSHVICNSSFTPYGNSARLWRVHIARTKLIIQAHKTPGGQHIFVLQQTTSWAICSKGWRDTTFKQTNSCSSGFGKNSLITHTYASCKYTWVFKCTGI